MGIADNVPPNLKLGVAGFTVPTFIIYTLVLVGCISTSPGIPGLYLFLLQVNEITLRVGYFAVCAVDLATNGPDVPVSQNGTASDGTVCVPTLGFDAEELSVKLFGSSGDVVPVLDLALNLQRQVLVPLIIVAAFLMLFGVILFALAKVMQMKLKNPETWNSTTKTLNILKPATLATIWMAVCFAFAAAVASTMAIGALNFIIPVLATNISVTGGKLLQGLQYVAFIFGALFGLGATLLLPEKLEQQQGMGGGEYPQDEKSLGEPSADESMMMQEGQEQQYPEGEYPEGENPEGQEQQYPEGQYPEGEEQQYPEGQYPEGQEQQYPEGQYPEGQEQQYGANQEYAEGGEYAQPEYDQQQQYDPQQEYQQQQYQQQ